MANANVRAGLLTMLMLVGASTTAGTFSGPVQTEWLADGRTMKLLSTVTYTDSFGREWVAPIGSLVDGASIPQFAWSLIGGPLEGKYRDASVIHDVYCVSKVAPWQQVHRTFYTAMLDKGVEGWRAQIMYAAVYHFGPRWTTKFDVPLAAGAGGKLGLPDELIKSQPQGTKFTVVGAGAPFSLPAPGIVASPALPPASVAVLVEPPVSQLTASDFDRLVAQIRARANVPLGTPNNPRDAAPQTPKPPPFKPGSAGFWASIASEVNAVSGPKPMSSVALSTPMTISEIEEFR